MGENTERRKDDFTRNEVERISDLSAEKALKRFGDLSPHDLESKEGREAQRADLLHVTQQRQSCEKVKSVAGTTIVRMMVIGTASTFLIGLAYTLGLDKFLKKLTG
ncbi:MAG: hypothetical protein RIB80_04565 [Rhodospirillales bacterium]